MPIQQKQPSVQQKLGPTTFAKPDLSWMDKLPRPGSVEFPDADARTFLMQPWVTIRGSTSPNLITSITQDEQRWLDLRRFNDAAFWVDVSGVTNPTTPSTAGVYLNIESSPTTDENDFRPVAPPLLLTPKAAGGGAVAPLFTKTVRSAFTAPLSRYTRWRLSTDGTVGTWDASFRIRGIGGYSRFWLPTDLAGCDLWLRGDLGITLNGTQVSAWADQSGKGHNASAGIGAQPTYVTNAMNGFPAVQGNGSSYYMTTGAFDFGSSATFIAAVQPLATTQTAGSRLIESRYDISYYLATDIPAGPSQGYKWIVNNPTPPYGLADAPNTIALANQIVAGVYDNASTIGALYLNGAVQASDTFTAPGTVNTALYIMRAFSYVGSFWNGYLGEAIIYNRALKSNEFLAVHRYLGARYGIAVP